MHTTQPATEATTAAAISYALNRHVPDMVRGFTIRTNYSDLAIQPGPLAARITLLLERALNADLAKLARVEGGAA